MKNYIKYFALIFGMTLFCSSCQKNEKPIEPPVEQNPPILTINENYIQVSGDGGQYSFTYTLENPNDSEFEATTDGETWINNFDFSTPGTVKFNVDPNVTGNSRLSQVTVKYGEASDKITVSQTPPGEEPLDIELDIEYDINGPYVAMTVTPTPENVRYYSWYYSVKGMEEALAQSPGVTVDMYFRALVEYEIRNAIYYGAYAGYTPEAAVAEITQVGKGTQHFELNGRTQFYGFACAVTDEGDVISDVAYSIFTTGDVEPSDNQIEVTIEQVNTDRISYSVNTSNDDQYAALIFAAEDIEGLDDDQLIEKYNGMEDYINYLKRGDYQGTTLVNQDDADYYVVVFGFEYGMATTEIIREKVHTLKAGDVVPPTFRFEIDKVTHYRMTGTVYGDPFTALYYVDYCYADENGEDLANNVREAAQWFVDNGYYNSIADCLKVMGTKGNSRFEFIQLEEETEYRIYAIGIDETTGEFNTDVIFSDVITTPIQGVAESYIEVTFDKYFDGAALAQMYPDKFGDAAGYAVVPLSVTKNGDVAQFFYDVYSDDLSDTSYPTDMDLIMDLQMYGIANKDKAYVYCSYSTILTLVSFCKDSYDNNSAVDRRTFRVVESGVSPIEEFELFE